MGSRSMSTALVGPLRRIHFRDGTRMVADPPRNTMDARWQACTDHHLACDCREAELAEEIAEQHAVRGEVEKAAQRVLAGHRIDAWSADGSRFAGCECTGCRLAREAHLWIRVDDNGFVIAPDGTAAGVP